jgi:hypothetical protein
VTAVTAQLTAQLTAPSPGRARVRLAGSDGELSFEVMAPPGEGSPVLTVRFRPAATGAEFVRRFRLELLNHPGGSDAPAS